MTFESNESMYTKLQAGGTSFDVIIPSDYMIDTLIQQDLQDPGFPISRITNILTDTFKNLDYDPDNAYSVPYTWGCIGIIYNTKYVNEEDTGSWDLLWNKNYAGKILMFDNPRDAFAIAESLLGYSLNTEDPEELIACADKLKEQKNLIQSYVMDQIYDKLEREGHDRSVLPEIICSWQRKMKLWLSFIRKKATICLLTQCVFRRLHAKEASFY